MFLCAFLFYPPLYAFMFLTTLSLVEAGRLLTNNFAPTNNSFINYHSETS